MLPSVSSTVTGRTPRTRTRILLYLPLNIGPSKTAASTVVNDLALTVLDGAYQLTGDVTNTGITDANGMVVSLGAPATPVEPYSSYAVGSLTSNDFSSFTLTFTSPDLSAIPIKTTWKDGNGNTLSDVQTFDLRSLASSGTARHAQRFGRVRHSGWNGGGFGELEQVALIVEEAVAACSVSVAAGAAA